MTPLTDMLREMFAKGVPHDAILIAVEGAERAIMQALSRDSHVTELLEKKRAGERARKQKSRMSRDSHVTSRDHRTAALVPQVKNLTSFKKDSKILNNGESLFGEGVQREVANVSRDKRGSRLPADWMPDDPDFGNEILGRQRAETELAKFRDHWAAQPGSKGVKLDWQATWRNWVRKAPEFAPRQGGYRNGQRSGSLMDALDELEQQIDGTAETDFELPESNLLRLPLGPIR